jgi:glycosyltransferase involved in cell wall biosynthesis
MKILVIGHTYVVGVNRAKYRELCKYPDVKVKVIVPKIWKDYLLTVETEVEDYERDLLFIRKSLLNGNEGFYLLDPRLFFDIKIFKPDILFVEEGVAAFSYLESIVAKKLFSRSSKVGFFTWVNWEVKNRFPLSFSERFNLKNSDFAVCGNQEAKNILRSKGFEGSVEVIPQLGVDTDLFYNMDSSTLKSELGLNGFVFGFVGRLVEEKGVLILLEAFLKINKTFRDIYLLLVGDGNLKDKLIEESKISGISDKLKIINPITHDKIPQYLNCIDCLILPSFEKNTWKEQFGHVLIEAMACEIPVIGSNSGEIPNVIGDSGLIFKEKDEGSLIECMQKILSDSHLYKKLAHKGRERVLEYYTDKKIAERLYKFFLKVISK